MLLDPGVSSSSYVSMPVLPGNIPGQNYLVVYIYWHQ